MSKAEFGGFARQAIRKRATLLFSARRPPNKAGGEVLSRSFEKKSTARWLKNLRKGFKFWGFGFRMFSS